MLDLNFTIEKIREVFRFSITDIARWVGVSRPTVYSWRDGKTRPESEEHQASLERLCRYAEKFESHGVQSPQAILHARFFRGESAFQLMETNRLKDQHIIELAEHENTRRAEKMRAQESVKSNRINEQWSLDSALPTAVVDSE